MRYSKEKKKSDNVHALSLINSDIIIDLINYSFSRMKRNFFFY